MSDPAPDPISELLGDASSVSSNGSFGGEEFVFEDETIKEDDVPQSESLEDVVFEGATTSIGDGVCLVCGAPTFRPQGLTRTGRKKRTPKYCDLHAPNVRISADGPDAKRLESQLQRVQQELADDVMLLGTLAGPLLPVTGYYLFTNADAFTIALIKLCKNNQRALRVLHRAASVAPVYEVAKCVAGVSYAVQVDTKNIDPHNMVGDRLGVAHAYDAVYSSGMSGETNNITSNGVSSPPRYATVQ